MRPPPHPAAAPRRAPSRARTSGPFAGCAGRCPKLSKHPYPRTRPARPGDGPCAFRKGPLPTDGLTYAVSFDDAAPQRVNVTRATGADDGTMNAQWARNTSGNVNIASTVHRIATPGVHVLKFRMVDPTVVLQNLVVDTGGLEPSYLGPPESLRLR